jgi:hypothetical protein
VLGADAAQEEGSMSIATALAGLGMLGAAVAVASKKTVGVAQDTLDRMDADFEEASKAYKRKDCRTAIRYMRSIDMDAGLILGMGQPYPQDRMMNLAWNSASHYLREINNLAEKLEKTCIR